MSDPAVLRDTSPLDLRRRRCGFPADACVLVAQRSAGDEVPRIREKTITPVACLQRGRSGWKWRRRLLDPDELRVRTRDHGGRGGCLPHPEVGRDLLLPGICRVLPQVPGLT